MVFLDLHKAYTTVDFVRLLTTLEGYGATPHMCRLLSAFLDQQEVFTFQNRYHRLHLKATRRTIQGGLISPTFLI